MNPEVELHTDRALVEAYLRTRSEAALALHDRHTPALHRFAARLCGRTGRQPAELVQESWLRALESLVGFRWGSSLRTWLCGIALNVWREARRDETRARDFAVIEGGLAAAAPPPAPM